MPGEVDMPPDLATAARQEITEAIRHLACDAAMLDTRDPRWAKKHASIDALLAHLDTLEDA